ncbi:MAG: hypothetical protein ABI629_14965, partial [bacterium]
MPSPASLVTASSIRLPAGASTVFRRIEACVLWAVHLQAAVEGWLIPGRNPFGLYRYVENVDELAARMGCQAEDQAWACTSPRPPIRMKRWCTSAGRADCGLGADERRRATGSQADVPGSA